jgi:hypothetical protein
MVKGENMRVLKALALAAFVTGPWLAAPASAQPLGTFRWQLLPYCNLITLTVVQQGGQYQLDGSDDQCGAGVKASVVGLAFQNPDGSIGFGLTIVTAPGGTPVHVDATISIATLGGTWRDSVGNNGTFTFTPGTAVPGSPRPVLPGGIAPGSITTVQIAPAAVTGAQLAPDAVTGAAIANGTVTIADLAVPPRAASVSGVLDFPLTGQNQTVRSVSLNAGGAGTVIVQANGVFAMGNPATRDAANCSISTGTTVDVGWHITGAEEVGGENAIRFMPFGATRAFSVGPGTTTFNLVCNLFAGSVGVGNVAMTAIFIPGP